MKNKAFTHAGKFHADDVFSAALLRYLNPDIEILRGFSVPEDFDGIVFDIGFGEFDHHQLDAPKRDNGVPYAAFGRLWKAFGNEILGDGADDFDETFVAPLDFSDNTGEDNELSNLIKKFNPTWDEKMDSDDAFWKAERVAYQILENEFRYRLSVNKADGLVEEAIASSIGNVVELSRFMPWKKQVCQTDKKYVLYPSNRGGYAVQCVPVGEHNKELRQAFPEQWRGRTAKELQEITGISGFTFCHTSGFLIGVETREEAWQIIKSLE